MIFIHNEIHRLLGQTSTLRRVKTTPISRRMCKKNQRLELEDPGFTALDPNAPELQLYLDPLPFCMGSNDFASRTLSFFTSTEFPGGQVSTVHFLRSSAAPELPKEMYYKKSSISYRRQEAQKVPQEEMYCSTVLVLVPGITITG